MPKLVNTICIGVILFFGCLVNFKFLTSMYASHISFEEQGTILSGVGYGRIRKLSKPFAITLGILYISKFFFICFIPIKKAILNEFLTIILISSMILNSVLEKEDILMPISSRANRFNKCDINLVGKFQKYFLCSQIMSFGHIFFELFIIYHKDIKDSFNNEYF